MLVVPLDFSWHRRFCLSHRHFPTSIPLPTYLRNWFSRSLSHVAHPLWTGRASFQFYLNAPTLGNADDVGFPQGVRIDGRRQNLDTWRQSVAAGPKLLSPAVNILAS